MRICTTEGLVSECSLKTFSISGDIARTWFIFPKSFVFNQIPSQQTWGCIIFDDNNTVHNAQEVGETGFIGAQ